MLSRESSITGNASLSDSPSSQSKNYGGKSNESDLIAEMRSTIESQRREIEQRSVIENTLRMMSDRRSEELSNGASSQRERISKVLKSSPQKDETGVDVVLQQDVAKALEAYEEDLEQATSKLIQVGALAKSLEADNAQLRSELEAVRADTAQARRQLTLLRQSVTYKTGAAVRDGIKRPSKLLRLPWALYAARDSTKKSDSKVEHAKQPRQLNAKPSEDGGRPE